MTGARELRRGVPRIPQSPTSPSVPVGDWGIWGTEMRMAMAKRFLQSLMAYAPTGFFLELRALDRSWQPIRHWYPTTDLEGFLSRSVELADQGVDVYLGVQPRKTRGSDLASVGGLVAVSADLDCGKGKGHPNKSAALRTLERVSGLGLAPSMLVDSGGGFHAYWLLRECETTDNFDVLVDVTCRVAAAVGGDPATTSVAQILRVPGTYNWKLPKRPRHVRLLRCYPERRFDFGDFDELEPITPQRPSPSPDVSRGIYAAPRRVKAAIDAAGWRVKTKRGPKGKLRAIVLDEPCPLCPGPPVQKERPRIGTAHIAPLSGALRCKRAKCPAGAIATGVGTTGEPNGLLFKVWTRLLVPGYVAEPRSGRRRSSRQGRVSQMPGIPGLLNRGF